MNDLIIASACHMIARERERERDNDRRRESVIDRER